jgi:nesprin-1
MDRIYTKLVKDSGLELENLQQLTSVIRSVLLRWHQLTPTAVGILQRLHEELQVYRDFVTAHGKAVVFLTQVDVRLTQIQHLATPEQVAVPRGRLQEIEVCFKVHKFSLI